ncbi:MAG: transcriptional regulator [Sulfurovum sp.]|nr:MAG: transcriptional regulator [Sulfurovum sp.]
MKNVFLGFLLLCGSVMALEVGKVPPFVSIEGKEGGTLDGKAWHSTMLKGKVYALFYVDPDERDLNNAFADTLKAKGFDGTKAGSVAIINLAATWMPNIILESKLKDKQKKYTQTLYVNDKKKVLVKKWGLSDDNSNILIFSQKGELIYKKFGKMSGKEIAHAMIIIEKALK